MGFFGGRTPPAHSAAANAFSTILRQGLVLPSLLGLCPPNDQ